MFDDPELVALEEKVDKLGAAADTLTSGREEIREHLHRLFRMDAAAALADDIRADQMTDDLRGL
jgi:hypothetical protein